MNKQFTAVKEDFICENCQQLVHGSGYTNHCPNCLYSKHVDLQYPGDRGSNCHSLMEPITVKLRGGQFEKISFKCLKCAKTISNKVADNDSQEELLKLPIE